MLSTRKSLVTLVTLTSAALLMLLAAGAQAANTWRVPGDYASIQAALDNATAGDTILVAAGTYRENLHWSGKDLVIQGAGAESTVIDGSPRPDGSGGPCIETTGLSPAARLEGVTVTGGTSLKHEDFDLGQTILDELGGGLVNTDSSPTVVGCTFTGNDRTGARTSDGYPWVDGYGGGVFNLRSSPAIIGCTISGNRADFGGGLSNQDSRPAITGCTFSGNTSDFREGAAIFNFASPAAITGCTFRNAWSEAIVNRRCTTAPGVSITGCFFDGCPQAVFNEGDNDANAAGINFVSIVAITHCRFTNAVADFIQLIRNDAGDLTMTGCLIADNRGTGTNLLSDRRGVAITNNGGRLRLINGTVVNNVGGGAGAGLWAGGDVTITNCLFWGNRAYENSQFSPEEGTFYFYPQFTTVSVTHSDVSELDAAAVYPGAGNLNADPLFADAAGGDYRLSAGSPCLNAGDNAFVTAPPFPTNSAGVIIDLAGSPRLSGPAVDLGAYEKFAYTWSGFLQPINADGTSVFKAGSTMPVKFQLTGASASVTNAVARLSYWRVGDSSGAVNEATSPGSGDSGNTFRYDASGRQYIFNWSTKGLMAGTYRLCIDLGDGVTTRTVTVGLK